MENREIENGKKKLYIIITNSLQNDFLEDKDLENDDYWIDYKKIENEWWERFEKYEAIPTEADIKNLIKYIKYKIGSPDPDKINNEISYHKYLEHYNHRAHLDYNEHKRIWNNEGGLKNFIDKLADGAKKANEESDTNKKVYYFIHLRDWHDETEDKQLEEFITFGAHCIKGSHGAEFIRPLKENIKKNKKHTFVINSNSLSSFADTNLNSIIDSIIKKEKPEKKNIKFGVFGVVSNIKILLLTFELTVVHKYKNVYVCKDFCAGFYKEAHEIGIDYIKKNLGVTVYNQKEFIEEFNFPTFY